VKKAAIVLVVLIGLLVVADFGAATAAEYQVSQRLRSNLNLPDEPAVRINGFPFLLQAFSGDYRDVEVKADGVSVARLSNLGVEATLHHVRVPFSDLVSGSVQTIRIDDVVGRVRVRAAELKQLINADDLQVEMITDRDRNAAGQKVPDNAVKLTGATDILGQHTTVTVIASLELVDGQVQVQPHTVRVDGRTLLPAVEQSVLRLFTVRLDPGTLPFNVTPTAVHADDGALVVEGTARDVVLNTAGSVG
jgi:LmeA-like phospholipid-binding